MSYGIKMAKNRKNITNRYINFVNICP